jgi:hypothetical protein
LQRHIYYRPTVKFDYPFFENRLATTYDILHTKKSKQRKAKYCLQTKHNPHVIAYARLRHPVCIGNREAVKYSSDSKGSPGIKKLLHSVF